MSNANERVNYLGFAPGGVAETDAVGDSLYNSLQAQVRHQFSKGLLLQFSYTWSKELTNINTSAAGSGIQPAGEVIFGAANSNSPLDLGQQYGLAAFNRSQRAVISYVYDLPYHKTEGLSGKLLGGWSVSGVTEIQNGLPFWIVDGGGASIYGAWKLESLARRSDRLQPEEKLQVGDSDGHVGQHNKSGPTAFGLTQQRSSSYVPDHLRCAKCTGVHVLFPQARRTA